MEEKPAPSMSMLGAAQFVHAISEQDGTKKVRNRLTAAGMSTEIVMAFRKNPIEVS
jgi:hypothetical protein